MEAKQKHDEITQEKCGTCKPPPKLPNKLNETILPQAIEQLHQDILKNPERKFYNGSLPNILTNNTNSSESFVIQAKMDKSAPDVSP